MNVRPVLLDGIDQFYDEYDGATPDHVVLPRSVKEEVSLEKLGRHRRFTITREDQRGLIGMQVWFSATLDERGKDALFFSDEAFSKLFERTKDFYRSDPYYEA